MRDWNNIEKQMKSVVSAHESTAPEFIWTAIDEELQKSRPKPKTLIYSVALILGLALSAFLLTKFMFSETSTTNDFAPVETEKAEQTTVLLAQKTSSNEEASNSLAEVNKSTIVQTQSSSIDATQAPNNFQKINAATTTVSEEDASENAAQITSQQGVVFSTAQNTNTSSRVITTSRTQASATGGSTVTNSGTVTSSPKMAARSPIPGLVAAEVLSIPLLRIEREVIEYTDGIECPTFSESISIHPFVELNGLFGRHSKSFSPVPNGEFNAEAFMIERENSESRWYNWGGQVHVGLNINRGLYFGTGLEWSQAKDKFEYSEEGVTKIVIDLDTDGNPIDTSIVSGQFVSTGEVRYTTLDLPIFAGFTKSIGSWDLGFEGAALINLSFSAHGKLLDEDLSVRRSEEAPDVYKDKLGLGLRGSVVLRKYLNNGFSFHIKPSVKTYLGEINTDGYPLDTKLSAFRLDLGFRKDF